MPYRAAKAFRYGTRYYNRGETVENIYPGHLRVLIAIGKIEEFVQAPPAQPAVLEQTNPPPEEVTEIPIDTDVAMENAPGETGDVPVGNANAELEVDNTVQEDEEVKVDTETPGRARRKRQVRQENESEE